MKETVNIEDLPCSVCILEPQEFLNEAILKYDEENECLVYCFEGLIDAYMKMGWTYLEAKEHICFNIESMHIEGWPIIL